MKLDEIVDKLSDKSNEILKKSKEIKRSANRVKSFLEEIDDESFDTNHTYLEKASAELVDLEYEIDNLIDDLLK
ncbi:hypothetical protein [Vagococcus fluvialis]|uniref:hypothetical protein n=1 Tax=Vagococcus fluvialis TaxID=2738 RepID=UPI003D0FA355